MSFNRFNATVRHANGVAIFDLHGRLVGNEGAPLRSLVLREFETGNNTMLLNCESLESADSLGLGDLIAIHASVLRRGGQVKLLNPHHRFAEILSITRLNSLFETYQDESRALASFDSKGKAAAALSNS